VTFLAPLWLALAAAAAVPVVLHLLRRRGGTRVEFPAVRFLLRAEREHRRELRLRNLALMLLRVAAVLLLALAAARPLGRTGGPGHAPTALAIVFDNSLSTGAVRSRGATIETLRAAALRVLDAGTPTDRAWVLTVDGRVTAGAVNVARDAVSRVQPIGGAGDLPAAIERGVALVRGSGMPAASLVVVTDAQASQWTRVPQTGITQSGATRGRATHTAGVALTIAIPSDPAPRNRSVHNVTVEPTRWTPRGVLTAAIVSDDSVDVRVALGERTLARSTVAPNGTLVVRGTADRRGWLAGRVELPADELRADDVRYFAVFVGETPAVRIDPSAGAFARGAIETLASAGRLELGGAISVTGAEAVVRTPVLAFAPAEPVRTGAANRALEAAGIPWRFGEPQRDTSTVRGGGLDSVIVRVRYPLIATRPATVDTIAVAGGGAWAIAGDGYVLVASPLDPSATTLPLAPKLLPWLEDVLGKYLLADGGSVVEASPTQRVTLPLGVDELTNATQQTVAVRGRDIAAPSDAGVYWMRRTGAVVGALAVNPEASESELRMLDSAALRQRAGDQAAIVSLDGGVAHAAFASSGRRPLAGALLAVFAGLLIVESLVARDPRVEGRTA
jgi:hypothetical protein